MKNFALIGAAAMIAAGNEIVQENDIDDPAHYIQKQLAQELKLAYGFNIDQSQPTLVNTTNGKKIASATYGAGQLYVYSFNDTTGKISNEIKTNS